MNSILILIAAFLAVWLGRNLLEFLHLPEFFALRPSWTVLARFDRLLAAIILLLVDLVNQSRPSFPARHMVSHFFSNRKKSAE